MNLDIQTQHRNMDKIHIVEFSHHYPKEDLQGKNHKLDNCEYRSHWALKWSKFDL